LNRNETARRVVAPPVRKQSARLGTERNTAVTRLSGVLNCHRLTLSADKAHSGGVLCASPQSSYLVTSSGSNRAEAPIASATCRPSCSNTSAITTTAPSRANMRAVAAPMLEAGSMTNRCGDHHVRLHEVLANRPRYLVHAKSGLNASSVSATNRATISSVSTIGVPSANVI
jgi:hypothetical protein